MTAPERIWIDPTGVTMGHTDQPHEVTPHDVEYIRADLARATAITAAQVEVKPLEWVEIRANQFFEARVIGILYSVRLGTDGVIRWQAGHMGTWFEADTLEDAKAAAQADYDARILSALEPAPEVALGPIAGLLPDAIAAAEKAMRLYPQPNYVISKWAEETGEVTKDLIHMAEGRQTADKLRGEIVQALAMLHRLMVEGDQVHGLEPIDPALSRIAPTAGKGL